MFDNLPELPQPKRRSRKRAPASSMKDSVSPVLKQVRNLDSETSKLLKRLGKTPEARHDTVDEALSLARECFHVALTRLEKMKPKTGRKTANKNSVTTTQSAAK